MDVELEAIEGDAFAPVATNAAALDAAAVLLVAVEPNDAAALVACLFRSRLIQPQHRLCSFWCSFSWPPVAALDLPALAAAWINTHSKATGVSAEAVNIIRVAPGQLVLDQPLLINGRAIVAAGRSDVLVNNINTLSEETGVRAYLDTEGYLHLTNVRGQEGQRIVLGNGSPGSNALGLSDGSYNGTLRFSNATSSPRWPSAGSSAGSPRWRVSIASPWKTGWSRRR
jgi:hypothetical protein